MGALIPLLECLLTLLVVALGFAALFWVLRICISAFGGPEIPQGVLTLLGAIAVLVLIIIAIQCIIGGGAHLIHLQ